MLKFVDECHFEPKSRVWRKAELFNVLVETHRALVKEGLDLSPSDDGEELTRFFDRVNKARAGEDDAENVTSYYKAAIQATNDRSNRIKRGQIVAQVLREGMTS